MISTWFCEKIDTVQVTSVCKVDDIWEFVTQDTENCLLSVYSIYSINRPGCLLNSWTWEWALIRGGRLFEVAC